jgi:hypothetical protein
MRKLNPFFYTSLFSLLFIGFADSNLLAAKGFHYHDCPPECEVYHHPATTTPFMCEKREKFTRRGNYFVDISEFKPAINETYEHYRMRIKNTLLMQEYYQGDLKKMIGEKADKIGQLRTDLTAIEDQNGEMRLALAKATEAADNIGAVAAAKPLPFRFYKVQKDDTLQKVAKKFYGAHSGWLAIYRFNFHRLKDGPNKLEIGDTLYIPNIEMM